jgi:hypothetical protein
MRWLEMISARREREEAVPEMLKCSNDSTASGKIERTAWSIVEGFSVGWTGAQILTVGIPHQSSSTSDFVASLTEASDVLLAFHPSLTIFAGSSIIFGTSPFHPRLPPV